MGAFGSAVGPELWLPCCWLVRPLAYLGNIEPHSGFIQTAGLSMAGRRAAQGDMRQQNHPWRLPYPGEPEHHPKPSLHPPPKPAAKSQGEVW